MWFDHKTILGRKEAMIKALPLFACLAVLLAGAEVFPFIPHVRLLMELLCGALEAGLLWWTWNRSMFSEPLVGGQLDTAR